MNQRLLRWLMCAAVLVLTCACLWLPSDEPEPFEHAQFSFKPLAGWQAREGTSIGGKNASNYLGMGITILAEATIDKNYIPRVTIASRALPAGATLEQEIDRMYTGQLMRGVQARTTTEIDGTPALVQRYELPLGEPWYAFQDTWLVKNGQVILIACHTKTIPASRDLEGCQQILSSLRFKTP